MQISWDDVSRTDKTGVHLVARLGIDVFVRERHIENWKADPDGQHMIIEIPTTFGKIYALGAFKPAGNSGPA
jgi:hypothetical protein